MSGCESVILDFGSFTRRGLMVHSVHAIETWGVGEGASMGRAEDRDHRSDCDGKVICPQTQLYHGRFQ